MADVAPVEPVAIPPPPKPEDYGITFATPKPPLPGEPSLAPMTERAAAAAAGTWKTYRAQTFEERNVAPGVPLDTAEGLSAWDALVLSTRNAKQDQFRYLQNKYGADKVRESDTGDWIVRVDDPATGKPKDIVADPRKLDLNDFLSVAGDVPEIAGYVLAEKGAAALPLLNRMKGVFGIGRDIVSGAGGAAVAGAGKDVAVRLGEAPLDLREIAKRRTTQFKTDVLLGGVTVPVQRFFQWTKSPFGGMRTETQIDAIQAQKYIKDTYGLDIQLTMGELTGNPDIIRREKFTGKVLGGAQPYEAFKQTAKESMQKLQRILMGSDAADDELLGNQIIQAIRAKTAPVTGAAEAAGTALEKAGQNRIMSLIEGRTLAASNLTATQVGEGIRAKLVALRDAAKAEADRLYGEFHRITGDQPNISGVELAKAAEKIKKDAASSFKPVAGGAAQQPSSAFVPETSVMRRLDEMIANKGNMYRFSDLQKMRSEVFDDLAKSEAVPGLGAHYLSRISGALTDAMEKGVAAIPDPAAKGALEAANKWYKEKVVPFSKKGINELFRNEFEAGYIGPAELASRLMSGAAATDRFNLMKQSLGSGSDEFKALKRSIADELLNAAAEPGGETLDARKFLKAFSDFSRGKETREIAKEVFGADAQSIMEESKFMIRAQEGAKFDADEVRKLLASGSPTRTQLTALLRAERAKDDLVKGQLLKAIADNSTDGLKLTPEDVVNRFINKPERNMGEISQVLALLADRPALTEDIRTKFLEGLFKNAEATGSTYSAALAKAGGDKKARLVLGNKLFEDLERYGMLAEAQEFPRTIAEGAGAMAGGRIIDQLFVHPFRTLKTGLREFVTAKLLTSEQMRAWASRINPSDPGAIQMILTSAPFVESVYRNFGPGKEAENFMQSVKGATDDWMKGMSAVEEQKKRDAEEFQRSIPQPLSMDYFKPSTNQPAKK